MPLKKTHKKGGLGSASMFSISLAAVDGRSAANYKEAMHPSSARFTAVRGILYSQGANSNNCPYEVGTRFEEPLLAS